MCWINRNYHNGSVGDIINVLEGQYFVSIGKDNVINYIDGNTRKVIHTYQHSDFTVPSSSRICVSPDGRYIIAGSNNGDIFCWDTQSNKLDSVLKPKLATPTRASCYSVAWNPIQSQIISSHGSKLCVWE